MDIGTIALICGLVKKRDYKNAVDCSIDYCKKSPQDREGLAVYGMLCNYVGRFDLAENLFRNMVRLGKSDADAYFNLGRSLSLQHRLQEALAAYLECARLRPGMAEVASNLATLYRTLGDVDMALEYYKKAEKLAPDYMNINIHLHTRLDDGTKVEDEVTTFQSLMGGNRLFMKSYYVMSAPDELLAESRRWDEVHGVIGRSRAFSHKRIGDRNRRLRIGYVSPDFRQHSVSYFIEPLLACHNRQLVEVYCYAEVAQGDAVTDRLKDLSDNWRVTSGLTAEQVAQQINDDRIDILIDLAGHTANNRMLSFTYKPAPIQVTYLGYFSTTGLSAMDYWLTDSVLTPADTVEQSSESLWRLPRCCLSYEGPTNAPDVVSRPEGAEVVFGNFNDLSKAGDGSVESWSKILRAVPLSRLLLKARQLSDESVREVWWEKFAAQGVERERVDLRGQVKSIDEHLALYGEIDIALDTMPRTGGTTTAEALWMGVPVISLAGERFIERLSATLLSAVGLSDMVMSSREAYVECAVVLANDSDRRTLLRKTLRERLQKSSLCDHRGLADSLESAYREMWHVWLGS